MKKKIAIAAVIAAISTAGLTQAYAGWGQRGGGYGYNTPQAAAPGVAYNQRGMRGGMQAPGPMAQFNQIDPAAQEKLNQFFADTESLRKDMAVKRAEKQALIRSQNPDPAALSKVEGELFDLRTSMHKKAEEAGVTAYLGPMNGPMNRRDMRAGFRGPQKGGRFMNNGPVNPGYRGPRF